MQGFLPSHSHLPTLTGLSALPRDNMLLSTLSILYIGLVEGGDSLPLLVGEGLEDDGPSVMREGAVSVTHPSLIDIL
jgi:hypothetical protein